MYDSPILRPIQVNSGNSCRSCDESKQVDTYLCSRVQEQQIPLIKSGQIQTLNIDQLRLLEITPPDVYNIWTFIQDGFLEEYFWIQKDEPFDEDCMPVKYLVQVKEYQEIYGRPSELTAAKVYYDECGSDQRSMKSVEKPNLSINFWVNLIKKSKKHRNLTVLAVTIAVLLIATAIALAVIMPEHEHIDGKACPVECTSLPCCHYKNGTAAFCCPDSGLLCPEDPAVCRQCCRKGSICANGGCRIVTCCKNPPTSGAYSGYACAEPYECTVAGLCVKNRCENIGRYCSYATQSCCGNLCCTPFVTSVHAKALLTGIRADDIQCCKGIDGQPIGNCCARPLICSSDGQGMCVSVSKTDVCHTKPCPGTQTCCRHPDDVNRDCCDAEGECCKSGLCCPKNYKCDSRGCTSKSPF